MTATTVDPAKIKVPTRSSWSSVEKALSKTPRDGDWHFLVEMGPTSAEQSARAYNNPGASWQLGYQVGVNDAGEIRSYLFARWVR
jgi:hypothetical protein